MILKINNGNSLKKCRKAATGVNERSLCGHYNDRSYYEYRVYGSLSTNLSQKGNSTKINPHKYPLTIGDEVRGVCCYDKKEHKGKITSFYKDPDGELVYIYILSDLSETLPLFPESVKRLVCRHKGCTQPQSINRFNRPYPGMF